MPIKFLHNRIYFSSVHSPALTPAASVSRREPRPVSFTPTPGFFRRQIAFLVNEGALVTACTDDTLNMWNIRQKIPEVVHTLKFQRERYVTSRSGQTELQTWPAPCEPGEAPARPVWWSCFLL